MAPNLRQVHLIPNELFDALQSSGFEVRPEDLGENIATVGLDLESFPDPLHVTEAGRAQSYSPDMLSKTLNHLKATLGVNIDPKWRDEDVEHVAQEFVAIAASATDVTHAARTPRAKIFRRGADLLRSAISSQ